MPAIPDTMGLRVNIAFAMTSKEILYFHLRIRGSDMPAEKIKALSGFGLESVRKRLSLFILTDIS